MREILFRGQTRRYGERVRIGDGAKVPSRWVYGGVLQGVGSHSIIYGGENENDPAEGLDKWCVYTDTLGQFTGLSDKNGKKIFEGDIIKNDFFWPFVVGVVKFGKYNPNDMDVADYNVGFYIDWASDVLRNDLGSWIEKNSVEIIGNTYDNPELLGDRA